MGTLLLEGGAEFSGRMADPDLRALELAGGLDAPIAILPTAAAPDRNHERAGTNGVRWFQSLGARRVDLVPVIDSLSADDSALALRVRTARLIYMLGGFPAYLANTLSGSRVWRAALDAWAEGAVLGGSSAGAMVLCEHLYDPESSRALQGLGLIPAACILPHHNSFGKSWAPRLTDTLRGSTLIGIDEQTGMLGDPSDSWTVCGAGQVTLYRGAATSAFPSGATFDLSLTPG